MTAVSGTDAAGNLKPVPAETTVAFVQSPSVAQLTMAFVPGGVAVAAWLLMADMPATKIVMAAILIGCCLNFVITLFGGGFTSNETNMSVSIQAGERTIIQTLKLGIPCSQDGWNPEKN
jgi:hypothetical protein